MLKKLIILHTIMSDKGTTHKNLTLDYSLNVGEAIKHFKKMNGKALPVVKEGTYLGLLFLDCLKLFHSKRITHFSIGTSFVLFTKFPVFHL